jgi:hypothetical protein
VGCVGSALMKRLCYVDETGYPYHFFVLGRGHPPPASKMAVQYMKEFKKLVKEVPCSEGIVLPHVLVSNFVMGLKFRQVDFFFLTTYSNSCRSSVEDIFRCVIYSAPPPITSLPS